MTIAAPQSTKDAARLLQRYGKTLGQIASLEATRTSLKAAIDASTDKKLVPLVAKLAPIAEVLEPWWRANAAELTKGERKSIELGGCMIGTKLGSASLAYAHQDKDFGLAKLQAAKWAEPLISVTYAVDKTAVRKALKGDRGAALKLMGYAEAQPESFFIRAIETPAVKG
ncbi:host-nuclease inhibitor Gam family protein [Sphingomonas sp. MG17]|uniref:Host-nuclease inhibitor Gam family protein n=1 Tax=Sphingomonas tagetis TaxID=2949092 RepID=A0A9X2HK43_9SPHN|nr:host-nuclease inhibitor Gam family protein [Sphingomonas tagetis]